MVKVRWLGMEGYICSYSIFFTYPIKGRGWIIIFTWPIQIFTLRHTKMAETVITTCSALSTASYQFASHELGRVKLPALKVGDRGFESRSGIQVSKKQNVPSPLTREDSTLWGTTVTER